MPAKLIVVEGTQPGTDYRLDDQVIVEVGRSADADVQLDDPDIVPVHLKIYRENRAFHIFDLSGRGFLVNGRRRLKHQLAHKDLITIGQHALRFVLEEDEPRAGEGIGNATEHAVEEDEDLAFTSQANATPSSSGRRAELQVIKGNDTGKVFDIDKRPMAVIGRGIATDITVWDIRCSRVHCRVDGQDGQYIVSDMNSSNGTYVNGSRLKKPHVLSAGDLIKIGSTVFQFAQNG